MGIGTATNGATDFRADRTRRASGAAAWFDAGSCLAPTEDVVRVFDEEPDLVAGVDARTAELLRRRAVVPKLWIEPGVWSPPHDDDIRQSFGLLVIDGLMLRSVELDGRCCPELVGAGDLLRPWQEMDGAVPHGTCWTALERTAVAVLDHRFTEIARRWPSVTVELLSRAVERSRSLAFRLAIAHVRHAELRVQMLFWHLSDRWGRVTPDGVHLPLPLTHEIVAQLACMRRPTASTAINALARDGQLARRSDGSWLLLGSPPICAGGARCSSRDADAA